MKIKLRESNISEYLDTSRYLYHGSNIKNLKSIQQEGLILYTGDMVKSTFSYHDYIERNENPKDVLFFSKDKDTWKYGDIKENNIDKVILCIVEINDTIYQYKDEKVFDYEGNLTNIVYTNHLDFIYDTEIPFFIENNDYFSFQPQECVDILYGKRLITFMGL
jgi:hypothetical protein